MSIEELQLLEKIAANMGRPVVPVAVDLWDCEYIAAYLKRTYNTVRDHILTHPTFPRPIRLPTSDRAKPLYKATEVMKWAEGYKS